MNLSKIEKTFIIVLIVGIIIGVGVALFIVPANKEIKTAESRLTAIEKERDELYAELERETTIDAEIEEAQKEAEELEGAFYPDLTTYEAVEIVQAHLKKFELETLSIDAELLTTHKLELEYYTETPVLYDLKTYSQAARGNDDALLEGQFKDGNKVYTITANDISTVSIADAETGAVVEIKDYTDTMVAAHKEALVRAAASNKNVQTVGLTAVSFDVKGEYGKYLEFIDYIFGLERATYMPEVEIPMTYQVEDDDSEESAIIDEIEALLDTELVFACTSDTVIEVPVTIYFFGVEQMEELETIEASGVEVVVNQ